MNKHIYREGNLAESLKRLNNKLCRIAYLGSSVTVQKEGYRFSLQKMLCEHSKKQHLEINASIGDTGSITGVFTMEEDVVPYKPDICFVEYMVSDRVTSNSPPDKIGASIEGIVRKLYAIDCEVIFLYRFLEKELITKAYNKAFLEHEKVAEHYNLCSINFGSYIQENIECGKYEQNQLFKDHTHTTKYGGEIIAKYISEIIFSSSHQDANSKVKANDLNKLNPLHKDCFQNTEIIYTHQGLIQDQSNFAIGQYASRITNHYHHSKLYSYFAIDSKNEFQLNIHGELVGLMLVSGRESGYIELEVSGEQAEYLTWDKWCHYDRLKTIIFDQEFSQPAKLKIRVIDKDVDYSSCRRTIENPHEIIKKLKLVALMIDKSSFNAANSIDFDFRKETNKTKKQNINKDLTNKRAIVCQSLNLLYVGVPKCACTSLKKWIYHLEFNQEFKKYKSENKVIHIHNCRSLKQIDLYESAKNKHNYMIITVIRDPIKRFISAYSNRVLYHQELSENFVYKDYIEAAGLKFNPDINYLVENLEKYQKCVKSIMHHTRKITDFIGEDLSLYTNIYTIAMISRIKEDILRSSNLPNLQRSLPEIPKLQTGGPKLDLSVLKPENFSKLIDYYAKDYEILRDYFSVETIKEQYKLSTQIKKMM
ncbi:MAG: sulfotransferase family 2 domain-containing protein [Xenococcaceae cyanobacterium MO_188.B29]|nr:sulfotransferase family 2 domain-containing protein [Xenococcaceae cyanobacterium MO_188.B29]